MKKFSLALILFVLGLGAGFSVQNYDASVNVLDPVLTSGDSLTLYGFINYAAGQGNPYDVSSLKLRYFKVGTSPSGAVIISNINYLSNYHNSENLLVSGAYYASINVPSLSNGRYTVELLINNEVASQSFFDYDSSASKDSKLSLTYLNEIAGSINAQYRIENNNATSNITYGVDFFVPRMDGLGASLFADSMLVQNKSSNDSSVVFGSAFVQGANILIARVSSTDQSVQKLPLSVLRMVPSGGLESIDVYGELSISSVCNSKEDDESFCEFSVLNTGVYPAVYGIEVIGNIASSVEFTTSLINPGQTVKGNITLNPVYKDLGSNSLTVNLKHSSNVLDSKQVSSYVYARDKISKIDIRVIGLNRNIIEGDKLSVNFRLNNTGDYDESVMLVYVVGETEYYLDGGKVMTLNKGQSISKEIDLTRHIQGISGIFNFEIKAMNEDMESLGGIVSGVNINPRNYEPVAFWNHDIVRIEKGGNSANNLTVQNNGNVDDIYRVIVQTEYATHTETVSLKPGEYATVEVKIVSSDSKEKGVYPLSATVCSEISTSCDSASFNLIIYELPVFGNAEVKIENESMSLDKGQAGIFEIIVRNNNANTREYKIIIPEFEGEAKISPETQFVLSGAEESFFVYLLPESESSQDVQYQVLESNMAIQSGNFTLSYGSGFLTGFITAGTASNIAVSILGLALLSALIVFGVRAFNQSKMELKYWK
ncbi:MAG: hypothetical protein PHG04_02305 [Candidatus Nanoarchaeia archaeon]|nr:hypothetical protein [Candidatus Nanoarchaeia archaeon]